MMDPGVDGNQGTRTPRRAAVELLHTSRGRRHDGRADRRAVRVTESTSYRHFLDKRDCWWPDRRRLSRYCPRGSPRQPGTPARSSGRCRSRAAPRRDGGPMNRELAPRLRSRGRHAELQERTQPQSVSLAGRDDKTALAPRRGVPIRTAAIAGELGVPPFKRGTPNDIRGATVTPRMSSLGHRGGPGRC